MRLGYVIGAPELLEKVEMLKQVNDVHTPMVTQMMCVQFMKKYDINKYIEKNRKLYKEKCETMLNAMEEHFPKGKVEWTVPDGGIFLWCTCPTLDDVSVVVNKALEKKVAIVPGSNFAIDQNLPSNQFRLNFSSASKADIAEAIKRLGEVLTEIL